MRKYQVFRKALFLIPILMIVVLVLFGSFYSYWNNASPENTCASCHEIGKSVNIFGQSSHRELECKECHGTALSNGFHSLSEKGIMVVNHLKNESTEDIKMNEDQVLEVMENCVRCHSSEYANWLAGGHSAKYEDIFLNERHNSTEQINFDCLRCHGMYSDVSVNEIVEPLSIVGPWKMKIPGMAQKPVIPCMACHQIHNKGIPKTRPDYSKPENLFYNLPEPNAFVSFFNRQDRTGISVEDLPMLNLWKGNDTVRISSDPIMRNCIQCHAPNSRHQAGTSDDRTPRGVHEGISCIVCHETHSNDARNSCVKCHPVISNCNLDVTKMNTSYANSLSENNIHWVGCIDCHTQGIPKKKSE